MSITHKKQAQMYTQQMIQMDKTKSVVHSGQVQMQVAGAINNASTAMGVINQQIQNTNITGNVNEFQKQAKQLDEMYNLNNKYVIYRTEGMQIAMGTGTCYEEENIDQYMANMQAMAAVDLAPKAAIGVPAVMQPVYQAPVLAQQYPQPQPPPQQYNPYGQYPQQQQQPQQQQFNYPGMGGGVAPGGGGGGGPAPSLDDLERRLNNLAK